MSQQGISQQFGLYKYQERAFDLMHERAGVLGLFMDRGTGKTRTCLAYLRSIDAQRILIVAPLWVVGVWKREIPRLPLGHYQVLAVTEGLVPQRASAVRSFARDKHQIVLTNYDSYWREPLRSALLKWGPDAVVLDEGHRIRHRGTRQARFAHKLAESPTVVRRLILTGSVIERGWEDLYSFYRFLDPQGVLIPRRWADFDAQYLVHGGYLGYQIVGYRNEHELREVLERTSFRITKRQALDLPDDVEVPVPVRLTDKTSATYHRLRKAALSQVSGLGMDGSPASGLVASRTALVNMLRLQQTTSGFAQADTGRIDTSDEKVRACTDLVYDALAGGDRVVVFCRFLHDVEQVIAALGSTRCARIVGEVGVAQRDTILQQFHNGNLDVVVCQIRAASLGVDFTPASVGIFFSTGMSLDDFEQAKDRLLRHGQTKKVTYYYLIAEDCRGGKTVDGKIYDLLRHKQDVSHRIATDPTIRRDMFTEGLDEE